MAPAMTADQRLLPAIKRGDVRGVREMLSVGKGVWERNNASLGTAVSTCVLLILTNGWCLQVDINLPLVVLDSRRQRFRERR